MPTRMKIPAKTHSITMMPMLKLEVIMLDGFFYNAVKSIDVSQRISQDKCKKGSGSPCSAHNQEKLWDYIAGKV